MPPRKSLSPKHIGPPKTPPELRSLDAEALGIPAGNLIPALQDLWDLEKEYALRKAVVLRKCGGENESV